jgi:NADH:ubiquinone oxidoreductase subunit 3 (subunit A)
VSFEQLVGEALHAADSFEPSPDLFAKVQRSIEEDALHRRRVRRVIGWAGLTAILVAVYLALTVRTSDGALAMSFRALELLTTLLMVALVVVLGPAIRRFGETYERDVFRSAPDVGSNVLRLLDIAYYLIFGSFIVMTLVFDPAVQFDSNLAAWIRGELDRIAGLLLLMGLLHVVLVIALPVVGLVHAANERRLRMEGGAESSDASADRIDRAITIAAWLIAAVVVIQMLFFVLAGVLSLGAPG